MMRRNGGFTIIELMVTIAILGILVAVAAPSMTESLAKRKLEGIANELSVDLQAAKSQAAALNVDVSLSATAHGYTVSSASTTYKTIVLDSTVSLIDAINLPPVSPVTVTFEPHRALPASNAAITVTHTKTSASLRVKTDAMGRVQLCSPGSSFGGYVAC